MGCHTWFYKKLNPQPTYDEVKEQVLRRFAQGNIDLYQKMIDGTLDSDLKEAYPEWNEEMGRKYLPIMNRTKRMIENGHCKVAVCKRYEHNESFQELTQYVNGEFYVSTNNLPHDLFRRYDYPEDKLFSLKETMDFISIWKDKMTFFDGWEDRVRKFWIENPDGMIEFG